MTFPSDDTGPAEPAVTVEPPRARVLGTGLIGGSIGLALRARGWRVAGWDPNPQRAARAQELGALDGIDRDERVDITFVAAPVSAVAEAARRALSSSAVVTDVGSVKAPIVRAVDDPRFVGGHPMAGSEQEGVDGADAGLFEGATWVLTPTLHTDPEAYARVRGVVSSLGAEVIAVPPERHDALVALVSHVPHLAAATLMTLAAEGAEEHATVLRMAAGGFRDMTRVAAGHPGIWPDICAENRQAIVGALDRLVAALGAVRDLVDKADRAQLLDVLERARAARMNLPATVAAADTLAELRVPVLDRPGVLAEITTLAADMGVNIADLQIPHSAEGGRGVLLLLLDAVAAERLRDALVTRGYHPAVSAL